MIRPFLSTTAVVLALSAPAWAQTTTDQPTTTPPPATEGAEPGAAAPAASEAIIPEQTETQLRAEDLMGIPVVGSGDEEIGKVEDLLFDEKEKITGVVVGVGGFLGIGKKEVGLDWDQAKLEQDPDSGKKKIVISLSKADLEAAPDFKTQEEKKAEEEAAAQQQQLQQQQAVPPPAPATTP
ncbi:MAG TPA: PRC-barrel domain-containing protein [Dongiaceae bacterium]|jgi:sporulation protein YlmC with PRC-barrel domain|nr:PRC-barrel domain-containing protein [Dongiaceae bacterium]